MPALILAACQGENTLSSTPSGTVVKDYRTATPTSEAASLSTGYRVSAVPSDEWIADHPLPEPTVSGVSAQSEGTLAPIVEATAAPQAAETAAPIPAPNPQPKPTAASGGEGESSGTPWYVPAQWRDAYLACISAPWRYDRTTWIVTASWPRVEAEYVADHEGGWDACQFNRSGSGACGWFQELPCQGLDPQTQIAVAVSKWTSCGYSFECAWYRWW